MPVFGLTGAMNCLIITPEDVCADGTAQVRGPAVRHVREVLKKKTGDTLTAGLLHGPVGEVRIVALDESMLCVTLPGGPVLPEPEIDLILAMPRPKVMKRLWSPLASLGLGKIAIIGAEKVEPGYFSSHALSEEVYRPRLIEGLAQVRDTHLPSVQIRPSLRWFVDHHLDEFAGESLRLIAHPAAPSPMRDVLGHAQPDRTVFAIGPEGGWTDEELALFGHHHFKPIHLGERTLRTDVAVISLLAIAKSLTPDARIM